LTNILGFYSIALAGFELEGRTRSVSSRLRSGSDYAPKTEASRTNLALPDELLEFQRQWHSVTPVNKSRGGTA